jgi:Flp pilus assembly protein TadD
MFCSFGQTVACLAADQPVKTAENRDTLLYVHTVPPGAKVLLDGKELGTSDGLFPVEPGVGTIVIELEGHKPVTKKVTIRAKGVTRFVLTLMPQAGAEKEQAGAEKEQADNAVSDGGNAAELSQQGWQLWKDGHFNEAAAKFSAAVKLNPKDENAWNGLGWARFNSGSKWREAEKAFKQAVALNPTQPGALNGLGQIYLAEKKYDLAETYLLKASPQASAAWYGLARLYLLQGKFEKAEKWAQMVVDSGQGDKVAERMLQAAKEKRLGEGLRFMIEPHPVKASPADKPEVEAARSAFEKYQAALKTPRGSYESLLALADASVGIARFDDAVRLYQTALEMKPNSAEAHTGLGNALVSLGRIDEAIAHYRKALELKPNSAEAHNGLGKALARLGRMDEAIAHYRKAMEIDPHYAAARKNLDAALSARK